MTWDMRSNMKAKPGSQGVLFRGGKDQMTDARWPRGYTPERLQIARSAVDPHNLYSKGERGKAHHTGPYRRDLIDTIARSTVPGEHLQGLQFHPGQLSLSSSGVEDPLGNYRPQGHRHGESVAHKPQIGIRQGYETGSVPIHEIGHHVSHSTGTDHSAYDTSMNRGTEEAFADDYASKHYRDKSGKPQSSNEYAGGFRSESRTDTFFSAYYAHRRTPMPDRESRFSLDRRAQAESEHMYRNPTLPGLEDKKFGIYR